MAKIHVLSQPSWYDELNVVAYYNEATFENIILQHLNDMLIGYFCFPFKYAFVGNDGKENIPDIIVIKKDYTEWWIVEVELKHHQLDHISQQVRNFCNPDYNAVILTTQILEKSKHFLNKSLNKKKVNSLLKNENPKVLVIVDHEKSNWLKDIEKLGASVMILELYKNPKGEFAHRLLGKYPKIFTSETHCKFHKKMLNVIEVNDSGFFNKFEEESTIEIFYSDRLTRWVLFSKNSKTYLRFSGTENPITSDGSFVLLRDKRGKHYIRRN
jgi:hypothetical protein